MRLAYIDPHPVPGGDVEALQILQNVDALARVGVMVDLVTPTATFDTQAILGRPLAAGVILHPQIDWRRRWFFPVNSNLPFFLQAVRWLRRHRVDAVFVRNLKLADYLLTHCPRVKLFFETHEIFAQTYREDHPALAGKAAAKYATLRRREADVYAKSAGLFALTQLLIDDLRRDYAVTTPAWVAADGVDLTAANAAFTDSPWAPQTPARLLYLGSLHPWKGVPTLIEAMQHVDAARLTIAGGNAERVDELRAQAASLGVSGKIDFVGAIAPAKRFALIAEHDVCLLPLTETSIASRYTSPLKLFEYMALAKPIVVADLPSIREVLRHGESGWLVAPASATAMADGINALLAQPDTAARLAANARQLALQYSWEARARRIADAIDTTIGAGA
ncbi:glycosyltransferase family 4 protein [Jeongeupia wiesaeckerbachi]|uniref:glycosyltransferase family 4 protein n=1 Tax=Jeongeupia wiesaeckerbachi TaxID=3051218 RepID=UPI003D80367D